MTDKEIIEALKEHYRQVDAGYSTHLEYGGKRDEHEEEYIDLLRDVIDLINRQQAEIEGLQNGIEELNCELDMAKDCIPEQRAEAIKEFAEQVKANKNNLFNYIYSSRGFNEQIDNLVKEMVGDTK